MDSNTFGTDKSVPIDNALRDHRLSADVVLSSPLGAKFKELDKVTAENALPKFELVAAADSRPKNADVKAVGEAVNTPAVKKQETVLDITDVGKRIGWWQQKEYEKLGVKTLRFGDHSVALELEKPVKKGAIVMTLNIDRVFAFNFDRGPNKWEMSNVRGLKIGDDPVHSVEITPNKKVIFWMDRNKTDKQEYGKQAAEFIKALADPLMADYLRR